jgi:hypothetical protein
LIRYLRDNGHIAVPLAAVDSTAAGICRSTSPTTSTGRLFRQ